MSVRTHPPTPQPARPERPAAALAAVVVTNVVLGVPAYFIAFLLAYGFRDVVGPVEHTTFLVLVAVFAVSTGLLAAAVGSTSVRRPWRHRLAAAVSASLSLNCLAVAVGSVVSARHKDENSVSAGFSTTTDVLVVVVLLAVAAVLGWVAARAWSPRR